MAKLSMFNLITLDGYFKGANNDISWHCFGQDEQTMSDELSNQGNTLLFGRVTYEMMYGYWASASAINNDPITARGMNQARKIVFSKTLDVANWQNTTLLKGDLVSEVKKLKQNESKDITILGSGQIVAQLAEANLIDHYLFLLNPVVLGEGKGLFQGLSALRKFKLVSSRTMKSGNILLGYDMHPSA